MDLNNKFNDFLTVNRRNRIKKSAVGTAAYIGRMIILLSIGFIIIYPLFYMIVCSVQSRDAFFDSTRVWIPTQFSVAENYKIAFGALNYATSFWATVMKGMIK